MNATDDPGDDGSWAAGLSAAAHVLGAQLPILTHSQRLKVVDAVVRAFQRAEAAEKEAVQAQRDAEAAEKEAVQAQRDAEGAFQQFQEHLRRSNASGHRTQAPPPAQPCARPAHLVLGCAPAASADEIQATWRRRAQLCHPDKPGGSTAMMAELNAARDAMLRTARP